MPNLKYIILSNSEVSEEDIIKLSKSKLLKNIENLDISNNKIGDKAIIDLLNSKYASGLKELDIYNTKTTSKIITALTSSNFLKNLERIYIDIDIVKINNNSILELRSKKRLVNLKYIGIYTENNENIEKLIRPKKIQHTNNEVIIRYLGKQRRPILHE